MRRPTTTEPETHVVLFMAGFLGRGFNSRRLHHISMEVTYTISLKETDEGYAVWRPGLPGCWSQGATELEAVDNMREGIREYLAVARELAEEGEAVRSLQNLSGAALPEFLTSLRLGPLRKPAFISRAKANTL